MSRISRRQFLAGSLAFPAAFGLGGRMSADESKRFPFFQPIQPPRRAQAMMHRGMAMRAPENTVPAIEACIADFVEWVEVDVRLSKDGQHVISHDAKLNGKSDGAGLVADHSFAELQKLDAGSWFAPRYKGTHLLSLAELLALAKGKINLYLDCKQIDPELLVKDVRDAGMEKQVIVYDSIANIGTVRRASRGTVPTMTKFRPEADFDEFVKEVAPNAVEIDAEHITAELCRRFHAKGIIVQAKVLGEKWDNPATWLKLLDAGVDWFQTDDAPALLMTFGRKHIGKWPVMVSCHRGGNRYAPENTLAAIKKAVALGVDFIEFDIRTTKDGKFVIMHDSTVNRTTNGKGRVRDLTFSETRNLDAGSWFGKPFAGAQVPTLDEVLDAIGDKASAYLDAKDIAPESLHAAVKEHGFFERHVVYQSTDYCAKLKQLDPRFRPLPPLRSLADLDKVAEVKPYAVDANWRILSKEMIALCHAKGIKVFSDALGLFESLEQYRKAIDWGLDLIQTDYPLKVMRAVELLTKE